MTTATATPAPINVHMELARLRKVIKLADALERIPFSLVLEMGEPEWARVAQVAGVNVPSQATIEMVVERLRAKADAEATELARVAREVAFDRATEHEPESERCLDCGGSGRDLHDPAERCDTCAGGRIDVASVDSMVRFLATSPLSAEFVATASLADWHRIATCSRVPFPGEGTRVAVVARMRTPPPPKSVEVVACSWCDYAGPRGTHPVCAERDAMAARYDAEAKAEAERRATRERERRTSGLPDGLERDSRGNVFGCDALVEAWAAERQAWCDSPDGKARGAHVVTFRHGVVLHAYVKTYSCD